MLEDFSQNIYIYIYLISQTLVLLYSMLDFFVYHLSILFLSKLLEDLISFS